MVKAIVGEVAKQTAVMAAAAVILVTVGELFNWWCFGRAAARDAWKP